MNHERSSPPDTNAALPLRILTVVGGLVLGFAVVGWRLYDLQCVRHVELSKKVEEIHKIQRVLPAMRGAIRDSNGEPLANDKPTYDVWINTPHMRYLSEVKRQLSQIEKVKQIEFASLSEDDLIMRYLGKVADVLAEAMDHFPPDGAAIGFPHTPPDLVQILSTDEHTDFPLITGLGEDAGESWKKLLKERHVMGVNLRPAVRRFYPCEERLTHVLGFVNYQHEGKEGIERVFNEQLAGKNGSVEIECDRHGREISRFRGEVKEPHHGKEVWLTIDMQLQELLENALEEGAAQYTPKKIVSVIVDPKTGAILAMASRPLPEHHDREIESGPMHRLKVTGLNTSAGQVSIPVATPVFASTASPAIAQEYEPGSVFKLITFSAVFDRHLANLGELINCDPDQRLVASLGLHDHVSDKITVAQVLAKSSNVGSYLLARRLGEDSFMDYVSRFGFGKKTGITLTGEIHGDVTPRKHWDGLTFSRMVIGHSIGVTPLQMAMATAAIANGGVLMKPQIVKEIRDSDGKVVQKFVPEEVNRVCSAEAAALVTTAMEGVVDHGTGKKAQIAGVRVAGKTGTSQRKKDTGRGYDAGHYAVSFSGFAPVEDPQLCIIVVVDDPVAPPAELTGGTLAGPIFAEIMKRSLTQIAVGNHRSVQAITPGTETTGGAR